MNAMSKIVYKFEIEWVTLDGKNRVDYEFGETDDDAYAAFMLTYSNMFAELVSMTRVNS